MYVTSAWVAGISIIVPCGGSIPPPPPPPEQYKTSVQIYATALKVYQTTNFSNLWPLNYSGGSKGGGGGGGATLKLDQLCF